MKKLIYFCLFLIGATAFVACNNSETYADQKNRERSVISKYLVDSAVTVISEEQFLANDTSTDVSKNEWVLFESSGVYMQVVRKGCGSRIKSGETTNVLCRFTERNMLGDSIQLSNMYSAYFASTPEVMSVTNSSGTFTGFFDKNSSIMYLAYGSTSVPQGWLVPLTFIKVGRPASATDEIARVRLIVPHDKGQTYATSGVYPCLYDITFEKGR